MMSIQPKTAFSVVTGAFNKLEAMMTRFMTGGQFPQMHRGMAEPVSDKHH